MTTYKIQHNVPVGQVIKVGSKYPFAKMKIGDSFGFPANMATKIGINAYYYSKQTNEKFKIKTQGKKSRIWRIK